MMILAHSVYMFGCMNRGEIGEVINAGLQFHDTILTNGIPGEDVSQGWKNHDDALNKGQDWMHDHICMDPQCINRHSS